MGPRRENPDCKEIFELLSEYIDAELPPELCDSLRKHIEGCGPCVEFLHSLEKTIELCKQYRPEIAPPPLAEHVRRDLRRAYDNFLVSRKSSH
jgi:anti-sigma factor (TIGR02949 family)